MTRQCTRATRNNSTLMSLPLDTTHRLKTTRRNLRSLTRRQLNLATNFSLVRPKPSGTTLRRTRRRNIHTRNFSSVISSGSRLIKRTNGLNNILLNNNANIIRRLMTRPNRRNLHSQALVNGVRMRHTLTRLNTKNSVLRTNLKNTPLRGRLMDYIRGHATLFLFLSFRNTRDLLRPLF